MSSIYHVVSFEDAVHVLNDCNVTFDTLHHFVGKTDTYHILIKCWKDLLAIAKPRVLSRFVALPFVPLVPPPVQVVLPPLPNNASALVREQRINSDRRAVEEDKFLMKIYHGMIENEDIDCEAAINLMKSLLSPIIKSKLEIQLATIPITLNKLTRMIGFLSTTYSPCLDIDISVADARMKTVNDEYGIELMLNVIDNERSIRTSVPNASQYTDNALKILVKLGVKRHQLKTRINTMSMTVPGAVAGGVWANLSYEQVCSDLREAIKDSPELETDLPVMKMRSLDINVNFVAQSAPFPGACHTCGKVGHKRADCPEGKKTYAKTNAKPFVSGNKPAITTCTWCKKVHGGSRCFVKEKDLAANPQAKPHTAPFPTTNANVKGDAKTYTAKEARKMVTEENELLELRAAKKAKKSSDSYDALSARLMTDMESRFDRR